VATVESSFHSITDGGGEHSLFALATLELKTLVVIEFGMAGKLSSNFLSQKRSEEIEMAPV
jgi:hypothetical protein